MHETIHAGCQLIPFVTCHPAPFRPDNHREHTPRSRGPNEGTVSTAAGMVTVAAWLIPDTTSGKTVTGTKPRRESIERRCVWLTAVGSVCLGIGIAAPNSGSEYLFAVVVRRLVEGKGNTGIDLYAWHSNKERDRDLNTLPVRHVNRFHSMI